MCGIAGYQGNCNREKLEKMLDVISHRGPDDRGVETFRNVGLGHNRLSIIELSKLGHQPMYSNDRNLCVVFNGEIYNFQDLKSQLKDKYIFKSNSDTEVILNSYVEWGVDCVQHFNGMFSFVIYDFKKDLLFGAVDRVGEKPLKYYMNKDTFVFASEVKSILSYLDKKAEIDPIAVDNYLTFQYVPSPKTGFLGIYKLPPAHYFIYKANKLEVKRYWRLDFTEKLNLSENEWEDLIITELDKAVKLRMISDVPIGALLSGGVDSSAVVALMSKNSKRKVKTFSVGFDNEYFNETKYAKMVSKIYNTDHTIINLSGKELVENISKLVEFYDEPIADNSILPTFLISKLTKKYVTVALTGDGGDENFAGYDRYNIVKISDIYSKTPKFIRSATKLATEVIFKLSPNRFTERLLRFNATFEEPFYKRYVNYNCFFTNDLKWALYKKDFRDEVISNDSFEYYKSFSNDNYSALDNALSIDIGTYLPGDLLYKTDAASMAFALELRSPLLDPFFMETMAKIPSSLKIKHGVKKHVFKKALVNKGILPSSLVYRRKQGFNIPLNSWFKGPLRNYVYETVLSKSALTSRIFDERKIKDYLDKYYKSSMNYDNNIFSLVMLSNWLNKYE